MGMIKYLRRLYYQRVYRKIIWAYFQRGERYTDQQVKDLFRDLTGEDLNDWIPWIGQQEG